MKNEVSAYRCLCNDRDSCKYFPLVMSMARIKTQLVISAAEASITINLESFPYICSRSLANDGLDSKCDTTSTQW